MSVLIKGMKMPDKCLNCPFMISRDNDDCILQSEVANELAVTWEDLKSRCPLVELPEKHGRLIDETILKQSVLKWLPKDPCGVEEKEMPFEEDICVSMMMEIEEQPTVIEAEGEE